MAADKAELAEYSNNRGNHGRDGREAAQECGRARGARRIAGTVGHGDFICQTSI